MTCLLNGPNTIPPGRAVAELGAKASQVYGILWESAARDVRDDCGGTTHWSKAALADTCGSSRGTISAALDKLLDHGFITAIGTVPSKCGGLPHLVYRVLHPDQIETQRLVNSLFDQPPSVRVKVHWHQRQPSVNSECLTHITDHGEDKREPLNC